MSFREDRRLIVGSITTLTAIAQSFMARSSKEPHRTVAVQKNAMPFKNFHGSTVGRDRANRWNLP